jgi:aryl-alcohol dehydrogenase-like predicted oxidoreductase
VKYIFTGVDVSRICLGCMSFGIGERGDFLWALNEDRARPMIKKALDSGISFFDTANVYSAVTSEEITGKILKE